MTIRYQVGKSLKGIESNHTLEGVSRAEDFHHFGECEQGNAFEDTALDNATRQIDRFFKDFEMSQKTSEVHASKIEDKIFYHIALVEAVLPNEIDRIVPNLLIETHSGADPGWMGIIRHDLSFFFLLNGVRYKTA